MDELINDAAGIEEEEKDYHYTGIQFLLGASARNFVAIGYHLKAIRDNGLSSQYGYSTVWEFAKGEFGLSKSTTSRFMAVNDKFSVGGNSERLDEKYSGFNQSQLIEMLNLPEDIEITPENTVAQIRQMKQQATIHLPDLIPGQMEIANIPGVIPENVPLKPASDVKNTFTSVETALLLPQLPDIEPVQMHADTVLIPLVQLPDACDAQRSEHIAAEQQGQEVVATSQPSDEKKGPPITISCTKDQFESLHDCLMAIDDYCALDCGGCPYSKYNLRFAYDSPFWGEEVLDVD